MPNGFIPEFDLVRNNGKHFHLRAIALAQASSSREIVAKMAKLKVKENTDAEMTGMDSEKSVMALVTEQTEKIREQLRKELLKNLPKKGKNKPQPKKPKGAVRKNSNRKGGQARKGRK
ncbi:hypothetical protein SLS56_012270 [Neofusicoccum ribis]|uniref:Uncharacterized protein n=1 Tax=Neofusicoccum ribis TaxID=45134 RepID=A0ABR3S9B0_9PEZI